MAEWAGDSFKVDGSMDDGRDCDDFALPESKPTERLAAAHAAEVRRVPRYMAPEPAVSTVGAARDDHSDPFVVRELNAKADIYRERNKLYGDNYKRFGVIMATLFPNGLTLRSVADFNRFGILVQLVAKETRYAENFTRGGHDDSLDDTAVYAMMLKELDHG